ncbi:hypothetical protein, partial [Salmonella enterica]|uniref:hypothetical protein n=1 Tax=Salmonella enterica TaxID=28901 RepID=UPI00329764DC
LFLVLAVGLEAVRRGTDVVQPVAEAVGSPDARPASAQACDGARYPCFEPVAYAFEAMLPFVNLDQRRHWYVDSRQTTG